jgi:hypothetical protein
MKDRTISKERLNLQPLSYLVQKNEIINQAHHQENQKIRG